MLQLSPKEILHHQILPEVKKLVSISATSTLVTGSREETFETTKAIETAEAVETAEIDKDGDKNEGEYPNLARVPCIRYLITFRKKSLPVSTLFDSDSEVNAIHPTFTQELGLLIRTTDIGAQKIDVTMLDTFGMVVIAFSVPDKANRVKFFEKTFLVANISPEVVFKIPFLTLNSADVNFLVRELRWRTYTTDEVLSTTRCIELVGKKEFAAVALDPESEIFVVYVASLSFDALPSSLPLKLNVYLFRRPQVSDLIVEEAPTKVSAKYSDIADVFSLDLMFELPEHTGINNHAIELINGQEPPYGPIYSLGPVELETLKAYIKTNLANGFITPSKSPAGAPILFDRKLDGFLQLYVNY